MATKTFPIALLIDVAGNALKKLDLTGEKVKKLSERATKVGKSMTRNLTLPLAGVAAASVKSFADFEAGMANVGTLIDTNVEDLDAMGQEVLKIAQRTPVPVEELTQALFDLRSGGVSAADQFNVLEKSAQLGVAGLGSTEQAARLVTGAMNAFELKGEDANKVFDLIFNTTKNGITTIKGLEQGFGKNAATIAASGTSLEEYLAATAALTTTTLPASAAQNQLRAAVSGLDKDSALARKTFKALGAKDFKDLMKQTGGLVPAFRAVRKEFGENTAGLKKLVGSEEAFAAILGLAGPQAEKFDKAMASNANTAGVMNEAFRKQNKTLKSAAQITKNNLTAAGVNIGKIFQPILLEISETIRGLTQGFLNLSPVTQELIVKFGAFVAAVGPMLVIGGKIPGMVTNIRTSITGLGKAFNFIKKIIVANPIGALAVLMTTAAIMIHDNWEHFEAFFRMVWKGVVDAFKWAWQQIKPIVDKVLGAVESVVNARDAIVDFIVPDDDTTVPLRRRRRQPVMSRQEADQMAARTAGVAPGQRGPSGNTNITVEFANAPTGTRTVLRNEGDNDVEVRSGFQMAGAM